MGTVPSGCRARSMKYAIVLVPWYSLMNALMAAGSRTSLASSTPARTWLRMIEALVPGLSWSCGLWPRGWFSAKYCGFESFPMSW